MSGAIFTHADVARDLELACDVCIVGSGAGGAVLAAGLAAGGLDVVVLEEGSRVTRQDFTLHEGQAYPDLYQERGTRASADQAITVLQGRTLGGSPTVNWTTCFRTPTRILDHWERHWGLDALDLEPHFEAVEERLGIEEWPAAMANPNNAVIRGGAEKLGWEWRSLRRNVRGCANSGYCGLGCPVDGKQDMRLTYLQDAVASGLRAFANVSVERLQVEGGRVVAVHGRVMGPKAPVADGPRLVVRPRVAVSSAGALNGPALLLRSGLDCGGLVGRRTFLHPVIGSMGLFDVPINPFYGAPQSMGSHHFVDRGPDKVGYFLEAAPLQPMLGAVATWSFGAELRDMMAELPKLNALIALSVDGLLPEDDGGVVTVRSDGRMKLDYPIRPFLQESFRAAQETLARLQFAAGARLIATGHDPAIQLRAEAELPRLARASYGALDLAVFTAHQMGGCTMGADASRTVVDPQHRFRGVDNLFVVDGSVLPTALGVNPSQTIYALARRATAFVGGAV